MKKIIIILMFACFIPVIGQSFEWVKHDMNSNIRSAIHIPTISKEENENLRFIYKYAEMLCDSLKYQEPIIFEYNFRNDDTTNAYINYGKIDMANKKDEEFIITDKTITLSQQGKHYDIYNTISLLNYVIENRKTAQKEIDSEVNQLHIDTIPISQINKIKDSQNSLVMNILHNKLYSEFVHTDSLDMCKVSDTTSCYYYEQDTIHYSYFTQDNNYKIFYSIHKNLEEKNIIDTVNRIYAIASSEDLFALNIFLFQNPIEFKMYSKDMWKYDVKKKRMTNQGMGTKWFDVDGIDYNNGWEWVTIKYLTQDLFFIEYQISSDWTNEVKKVLFMSHQEILIQDFDDYLDKHLQEYNEKKRGDE